MHLRIIFIEIIGLQLKENGALVNINHLDIINNTIGMTLLASECRSKYESKLGSY